MRPSERGEHMAKLRIRTWGDPILKQRTQPITTITDEIRQLVKDMFETLQAENGVGLAANQVGSSWRLFVAEVPVGESELTQRVVVVNPKFVQLSRETENVEEGCLSFPGIFGSVERAREVELQGLDLKGQPVTLKASGLLARAFQHELDHLDGVVFIERMKMVQRLLLNRQLNDLAKHSRAALSGHGTPRI
jgi:peptide deformylase